MGTRIRPQTPPPNQSPGHLPYWAKEDFEIPEGPSTGRAGCHGRGLEGGPLLPHHAPGGRLWLEPTTPVLKALTNPDLAKPGSEASLGQAPKCAACWPLFVAMSNHLARDPDSSRYSLPVALDLPRHLTALFGPTLKKEKYPSAFYPCSFLIF